MNTASVIIPAHNEQATIGDCLAAAAVASAGIDLDIVVVVNGCTDQTAERVRAFSDQTPELTIRVIETSVGSKANALELGRVATAEGCRIYLDADIVVSREAFSSVLETLEIEGIEGSAPSIDLEIPVGATWPLQQYASIWKQAPYFSSNLIGSGFYGLTADAQARIGSWPSLIADDLVALCHLEVSERKTAEGSFRHTLPNRLRDVAKVEVRREAGRLEFQAWADAEGRAVAEENPGGSWLKDLAKQPSFLPGLVLFVGVKVLAKVRAKRAFNRNDIAWGQDEHGREQRASS